VSYVLARGMGDAITDYQIGMQKTQQGVQVGGAIGSGIATAAVGAIAHSLAASGGSILGLTSATLSAAVPFIGPALMGATMLAQYLIANSGCGQTCIITSQWANQAADALQQNLDAYFALPAPRTKTQQALALANFDSLWAQLKQACGQPGTGDAGKRCISDRQRGACTWRNNGQCWDWFIGYRDPIANDSVVPDPTVADTVSSDLSSIFGGGSSAGGSSSSLLPVALLVGLVALGVSL
jgi:hypothetical protein